jgi:predicted nucleic acid-binding protein
MGKFNDVWSMLFEENKKITKGKKHQNVPYSKKKEAIITQALLNEKDYVAKIVKSKDGKFVEEEKRPVEEFRKQIVAKVLNDNGIDKQQAADAAEKYQFSLAQAQALNDLSKESTEQFLRAGFTYKFHDKPDFSASIKMRDVEDRTTIGKVPNSDRTTKTHEKAHKVIVKKSGTPRYCKERID